jgi:long-chain acyl-CoA synthetase
MDLVARADGRRPPAQVLSRDDVAVLTYTSGTTGPPKGAMNTHGNVLFTSQAYREWVDLTREDVILGIAPLFHVTGLIGHLGVSLLTGAPLVLGYRFDASTIAELVALWQPTFSIAAITAYRALLEEPLLRRSGLGRLRKLYTGGAPVPSATLDVFDSAFDVYLHNAYGLTETTSPATLTPLGTRAPIDPTSGTVSIGVPIYDTDIRVLDDDERVLAPGEVGEIVISGPQVVPGYWDKPEETAHVLRGGALHTGDVGFTDERGWVYLVDRKKDMIAAAGYKVWPREVEDVLYEHPAVREAAVVGEPDPYRGETVAAYVSLQPEAEIGSADLIAYCRERMAAYKYPRRIEIVEELPKTASGKILRRALRAVRTGE